MFSSVILETMQYIKEQLHRKNYHVVVRKCCKFLSREWCSDLS